MNSLKTDQRYHETKLFLIHGHFELMDVAQLNHLVDILMEMLHVKDIKMHPALHQYNTIKYSLLIYQVCFKIEKKKIYSLITKCSMLQAYLEQSITQFLKRQSHIAQLSKLMQEPIFHMTEKKDSLDLMLEMKMDTLLKHPVIVEVLNLVYEGQYSCDSSALNLSLTFQSFFKMEAIDLKSITQGLV